MCMCDKIVSFYCILIQNCYSLTNLMKKNWQFHCLWLWNFDVSNYWWSQQLLMMLKYVVSNRGATICQIMGSTDDFWWSWTASYLIMEDTVITCFLRQDFQWGWTMYEFTHILGVIFADGFIWLLLYLVLFLSLYYCIILCNYWSLLLINRYIWTHWWTIFIGQQL